MIGKSQQFSKDLKIQKLNYKDSKPIDRPQINDYIEIFPLFDINTLKTDHQKLSFWINMYNGLTNYLIIKNGIKKSMMEQPQIFFIPKVQVGAFKFSLDDIEHGILRKNTRHRRKLIRQFPIWDPRKHLVVDVIDHRIHSALNCGAESCPPIAYYSEEMIEEELKLAKESFAEQEFQADDANNTITCSQLYIWYKRDFQDVYLNDPKYRDYKVIGKKYDWSI